MDVVILRWPSEERQRETLRREGRPRLLLVDGGEAPPTPSDTLEDWIRVPAPDIDLRARLATLAERAGSDEHALVPVYEDGVVRRNGSWVSLPPVEARLFEPLFGRLGRLVPRDVLLASAWPDGARGNVLDVHVLRLRRRLAPLGLVIRTVRARGYVLEEGAS